MKIMQLPREETYEGEWEDIALNHTIRSLGHWMKTVGRTIVLAALGVGIILFFLSI